MEFTDLAAYVSENSYPVRKDSLDDGSWSLAGGSAQTLLEKLRAKGVPLADYLNRKIYIGVKTGLNEAFVIDATTRRHLIVSDPNSADLIKPFLMGRDVKRYETPEATRYLILIPNGWTRAQSQGTDNAWNWLKTNYPAIARHLEPFEAQASARWDKGEYWWELRPCDYYDDFEKPKIVCAEIATRGQFALEENSAYCDMTTFVLGSSSKYLLGVLNSTLATFVFSMLSSQIRGGFLRWKRQYMFPLPIRTINFDDSADKARHDRMVQMVEQMIALRQEHAREEVVFSDRRHELAQRIERLDRDIDALVYTLYGLTDEEIAIVEGR